MECENWLASMFLIQIKATFVAFQKTNVFKLYTDVHFFRGFEGSMIFARARYMNTFFLYDQFNLSKVQKTYRYNDFLDLLKRCSFQLLEILLLLYMIKIIAYYIKDVLILGHSPLHFFTYYDTNFSDEKQHASRKFSCKNVFKIYPAEILSGKNFNKCFFNV